MSDTPNQPLSEADAELEREIRDGRKFTLAEAIGRLAGPGAMKGESPATRLQQLDCEISMWLSGQLVGLRELEVVLTRDIRDSELLLSHLDQPPLRTLAGYVQRILDSEYVLQELVRNVDIEWGRTMDERPHFEREGMPSHPEDPYTIASVRRTLSQLLGCLTSQGSLDSS